jgi:hypothetical protein
MIALVSVADEDTINVVNHDALCDGLAHLKLSEGDSRLEFDDGSGFDPDSIMQKADHPGLGWRAGTRM